MKIINIQTTLRPELPHIYSNIDYKNYRNTLIKIDEILDAGQLEEQLIEAALAKWVKDNQKDQKVFINSRGYAKQWKYFQFALRCNIARCLTGESLRKFSVHLADSQMLQWFTRIDAFAEKKSVSKSAMDRCAKLFDESVIARHLKQWQTNTLTEEKAAQALGLNQALDFGELFLDATCVKANIHFPVDWVLLRDAAKSLLCAIQTIRSQNLKHRMIEPASLMKKMNKLCISMTHTRRKKDGKKQRKNLLRSMKKLTQCIRKHAERYRQLLINNPNKTSWTEKQIAQVISRIENILHQLPAAIKQAHERIIGERKIQAGEKILSLYDSTASVLIRGKAGNEVEFGQGLTLVEQRDGILVDWELFKNQPKPDSQTLQPIIQRIKKHHSIRSVSGDRGYDSKANQKFLEKEKIYNGLCPRNPNQLEARLRENQFVELQQRRSQTEGRIGIFKNVFMNKPLKSRIFSYKQTSVALSVLTHNLWVIARKALADEQDRIIKAA